MSKIAIRVFIALIFCCIIISQSVWASNNLIINGDFENKVSIPYGPGIGTWGYNNASASITEEAARSGNYGLRVVTLNATWNRVSQKVPVEANTTYIITAYAKSADSYAGNTTFGINYGDAVPESTADDWVYLTATHTFDEDSTPEIFITRSDLGTFYIDDFYMEPEKFSSIQISNVSKALAGGTIKLEAKRLNQLGNEMTGEIEGISYSWSVADALTGNAVDGVEIDGYGNLAIASSVLASKIIVTVTGEYGDISLADSAELEIVPLSDILDEVKENLIYDDLTDDDPNNLLNNLTLPLSGSYGATISWQSDNESIISNTGRVNTGKSNNTVVNLTATIELHGSTTEKVFTFTVLRANPNLIKNGGFELGNTSSWQTNGASAQVSAAYSHTGDYGCRVYGRSANWNRLYQTLNIQSNTEYVFSVYLKLPTGVPETNFKFNIVEKINGKENFTTLSKNVTVGDDWVLLSEAVTYQSLAGDDECEIAVYVSDSAPIATEYYMDDFVVEYPEIKTVNISGLDFFRLPKSGSITQKNYIASVLDQAGGERNADVVWEVFDHAGNSVPGLSIDQDGRVFIDDTVLEGDIKIIVTATYDYISMQGEKTVTLLPYLDESQAVSNALDAVTTSILLGHDKDALTKNLSLPESYSGSSDGIDYTVAVTYASNNDTTLTNEGVVIRHPYVNTNASLILTASLGEVTMTRTIDFIISKIENFVENGDFEEESSNWYVNGTAVFERSSLHRYDGQYGGLLNNRLQDSMLCTEVPKLVPERTYYFGAMLKGPSTAEIVMENDKININFNNPLTQNEYTMVNTVFQFTGDTDLILMIGSATADDIYIDNVSILDITEILALAVEAVSKYEASKSINDYAKADENVELLPDCARKTALRNRIDAVSVNNRTSGNGSTRTGTASKSVYKVDTKAEDIFPPVDDTTVTNMFNDIAQHWAIDAIVSLAEKKIISGYDDKSFKPENTITRAEFVKLIVYAMELDMIQYHDSFADVSNADWYGDILQTAFSHNIISGSNGLFRPDDRISREEMTKIVVSTLNLETSPTVKTQFSDDADISDWARPYIEAAVINELVMGIDEGKFSPRTNATRAEAALIIQRLLKKQSDGGRLYD